MIMNFVFFNPPTWLISGKFVTAMSMSWTLTCLLLLYMFPEFVLHQLCMIFTSLFSGPTIPLWVRPSLSTQGPSKTKTKTKTQWPRTNIRYVRTHHPLFECHQDWVLRDNCKLHDGFLAEVFVRPDQTFLPSWKEEKNIFIFWKWSKNKITWEAEHYDHFHQASAWLHTWGDGHLSFQQTTRTRNTSIIG